jgi:hypothetical protein
LGRKPLLDEHHLLWPFLVLNQVLSLRPSCHCSCSGFEFFATLSETPEFKPTSQCSPMQCSLGWSLNTHGIWSKHKVESTNCSHLLGCPALQPSYCLIPIEYSLPSQPVGQRAGRRTRAVGILFYYVIPMVCPFVLVVPRSLF